MARLGPAVQVAALREVGIAAEQHPPEAALPANRDDAVHDGGRALVRGSVSWPVQQPEHLAGIGQRDDERVVAPVPSEATSMPCLHWPVVSTRVPSMSRMARSKNASGWCCQTRWRT